MKIKLELFEIIALQTILKKPGVRIQHNLNEMVTSGLVDVFEDGYRATERGKLILSQHMPFLNNGQNMKQPLGLKKR